eukprot:Selendium_serpulae@DN4908_c0_g1_i1.p1
MATIGSANFDEDDSEDDDYVDSGGDSEDSDGENDEGQEDDGPNQIAAQAQREVAAAQYKEMLETEKSTMAAPYVPTPDAKFMLQFQKRQPPLTIERENAVDGAHGGGMADLDKLMAELGDKKKITSIEKSQADWLHYRETQGGEDELRQNRKDGYLQKQKFLRRTEAGADFA